MTDPVVKDSNATYTPGISERRAGSTRLLGHNLKSVDNQSTTTPSVSAWKVYDAFGNVTSSAGTFLGPFGYGGGFGYQEDATGLKLLGHRLYDSSTGRFLTRDPIKDGRNWYVYCDNDPLSRQDSSGLSWHDPGVVYVDPEFKGRVIVFGEQQGGGESQVAIGIRPGHHSNPHVDVDVVLVILPDGSSKWYAIIGTAPPGGRETPQLVTVGKDGTVGGTWTDTWTFLFSMWMSHLEENFNYRQPVRYEPRPGKPDMAKYEKGLNPE